MYFYYNKRFLTDCYKALSYVDMLVYKKTDMFIQIAF